MIAASSEYNDMASIEVTDADAALIAAAPDMHAYIVKRACVGDTEAQAILDAISAGAAP